MNITSVSLASINEQPDQMGTMLQIRHIDDLGMICIFLMLLVMVQAALSIELFMYQSIEFWHSRKSTFLTR